ncbi:MAG: SdrD B-like domain-containing protein [Actinomycetota bacterium]
MGAAQAQSLTVVSAEWPCEGDNLTVTFSEPVDPATATDDANYSIDQGITVDMVVMGSQPNEVVVFAWPISTGVTYTLTVNNVTTAASPVQTIAPDSEIEFGCDAPTDCEVESVSINTGFDHTTGGLYPVGAPDAFWTVVADPDAGTTEPRPAAVITPHPAWEPALPDSGWISAYATAQNNLNGPYDLETTFCLQPDWSDVELDLSLRADDWAEVYLNGTLIGTTPNPSFNTASPTAINVTDQTLFVTGPNTLQVRMINSMGVAMGVNLAGQVRGAGLSLEDSLCCQPESSLSGQKFNDFNTDGVWDSGEPALSGWTIELSNGDTAVTDSNGFYYFQNLAPGTYTISEVQQPGWAQTYPVSGDHTVTLGASQSISGLDFGNHQREVTNDPPRIECPEDIVITCDSPTGPNITISAPVSDSDGDALTYVWEVNGSAVANGSIPAGGPPTTGTAILTYSFPVGVNSVELIVTDSMDNSVVCKFTVTNECDPCSVESVTLNTGFDHTTGGLYPVGAPDAFWTVVADPDAGTTEPRPAAVITPHPAWEPALPDSGWISAYATAQNNLNGPYDLETTFCLQPDWSDVELDLSLRADDWAEVYLNGTLIGTTPNPSFNTASPTAINVTDQTLFVTGPNTLQVRMINSMGVAMGVNLAGQVRGAGLSLEDSLCCQPESSLSGQKFNDFNTDGVWDSGEPALSGWTIELSNGDTAVTDSNGFYYFQNLAPGTYTISEVQQPGWAQTYPVSGDHTVTLGASQSISGLDFGNHQREVTNDPPRIECPEDIVITCDSPTGPNITISAPVSDSDGDALTYVWEVNGSAVANGSIPAGGPPTTGTATLSYSFTGGVNTVVLIVTDSEGNTASCKFSVTVEDTHPPRIRCPEGVITLPAGRDCMAILPEVAVEVWDDCTPQDELIITQTPAAGTPLPVGTHTVVITVTDAAGNQSSCKVQIRVRDTTPPIVICPEPQTVEACEAEIPDLLGEVSVWDNCSGEDELIVTQTPAPGTVVGDGTHVITITAVDAAGNVGTCSTTFTVNAPPLSVEPIELFNTAVDGTGTVLPDGAVDPHYAMVVSADPNFPGPDARVVNSTGYPMGSWILNDANSKWIAPRQDAGNANASGEYIYEKTFTLPAGTVSANISGRWLTDNRAELRLNGVPTGDTKPANGFSMWTNFNITSGFVPGVNTLEFVVTALSSSWGADFPTGLRVELEGRAVFCETPCVAPHILQNPISLIRPFGSMATFSVSAGGSSPLSYQWYFNGAPIPGATSSTLSVGPLNLSHAGAYHVIVSNDCGEVRSRRAVLTVRRRIIDVIGHWDFERTDPLGPTTGGRFGYLDADNEDYGSTASVTHFGSTEEFGIPGIGGRAVNVMRIGRTTPERGYRISAEAPAGRHTLLFDLFFPEELSGERRPLLQTNLANDSEADLYLNIGAADCDDNEVCVEAGAWVRIAVTLNLETKRMTWFINGAKAGEGNLRETGSPLEIRSTGDDNALTEFVLFTDGSGENDGGYVSSIQWQSKELSDLEIAALDQPTAGGIPSAAPHLLTPDIVIAPEGEAQENLLIHWMGEGFKLQESSDLQNWTDSELPQSLEIIGAEVLHEVILPRPAGPKRFYRVVEE